MMDLEVTPESVASAEGLQEPVRAGRRQSGEGVWQVGKNAFWLLISFAVLGVTQFGILGLITRLAGVEEAGVWAIAHAFRDPFVAFMDFGTTGLLVAEIARRREESDTLLGHGLTLGLLVGLPVLGVMIVAANLDFLKFTPLTIHAIYWTGLSALIFTTAASFRSAFRAFNRLQYEALLSLAMMVLSIASAFVILYFAFPYLWLFAALAGVRLVALAGSWWIYNRRLGRLKLGFNFSILRQLLNKTWAFTLVSLLSKAFARVDVLILGFFHGTSAAGYYGLATTLFYQLNTVAQLTTTAILPNMAQAFVRQRDRIGRQLDAAVRVQILVGLPCTAVGLLLAPQIIRFFYGRGYEDTALVFQLLVMVVLLRFLNQTLGTALTAMDQQGRRAAMLTLTVVFNLGANFALVPRWSVMGATVTSVASEVMLFVLTYLVLLPAVRRSIQWGSLGRPLLSTLALVPLLYLVRGWPLVASLPLMALTFAGLLLLFRTFSEDETRLLIGILERIRPLPVSLRKALSAVLLHFAREQSGRAPLAGPISDNGDEHGTGA